MAEKEPTALDVQRQLDELTARVNSWIDAFTPLVGVLEGKVRQGAKYAMVDVDHVDLRFKRVDDSIVALRHARDSYGQQLDAANKRIDSHERLIQRWSDYTVETYEKLNETVKALQDGYAKVDHDIDVLRSARDDQTREASRVGTKLTDLTARLNAQIATTAGLRPRVSALEIQLSGLTPDKGLTQTVEPIEPVDHRGWSKESVRKCKALPGEPGRHGFRWNRKESDDLWDAVMVRQSMTVEKAAKRHSRSETSIRDQLGRIFQARVGFNPSGSY